MTVAGYWDFGGGDSDVVVNLAGDAIASSPLKVWTAITGGTQVTDLKKADDTTISGGIVYSNSGSPNAFDRGRWSFQAPDTYSVLYLDRGYGDRWAVAARQAVQNFGALAAIAQDAKDAADAATLAVAGKMDEADADVKYTPFAGGAVTTGQWDFDVAPTVAGVPLTGGAGGPHAATHAVAGGDWVSPASIGALDSITGDARYVRKVNGSGPDAFGNVNTAIDRRATAAAILAAAEAVPTDINKVLAAPPTIAVGTAAAASTISGGIKIAPKQVPGSSTGRAIDTQNDPNFEYIGVRPGHLKNSSVTKTYPDLLTGGSSNSKRDVYRIRFQYTGQVFEYWHRVRTASVMWRLWVDGVPMTTNNDPLHTGTVGSSYYYKVTFADARPRIIMVEMYDAEWGGIVIEPLTSIFRTRVPRRVLHCFGDSITDGSTGVERNQTWVQWASRLLNMDWVQTAIGGTGYLTATSPLSTFRDRLDEDVLSQVTDCFVMFGGYNDWGSGYTATDIATEAGRCLDIVLAGMPTSAVMLAGMYVPNGSPTSTQRAINDALRNEATIRQVPFIDLIDTSYQVPDVPAWVASKTYYEGDEVVRSGLVYKALIQHANVTFTGSQWRQTTFITGSGKTTALAGDGNADVYIGSDGVHPTLDGHKALGFFMYDQIVASLRKIAGIQG